MFKPLEDVMRPDPRYGALVAVDGEGAVRPLTLADHHASIADLDISDLAPDDVRTIFSRARHAFLYAWFDYELTPLAEQQALAAGEAALRHKVGRFLNEGATLIPLAEKAVKEGLLPTHIGSVKLPYALGSVRNHWAHGSANFGAPGMALTMIELCARLIDGLRWDAADPSCEDG